MWSLSPAKSIASLSMSIWIFCRSRVILRLTQSFRLRYTIVRLRHVMKITIIGLTLPGVFFPILCALLIQASGISSSKLLNNSLHLSNTSSEVLESSPSTSKILRQSLLRYCSKSSHFLTRREDTVLETSNEFSHSARDSSNLSILSIRELTVSARLRIKFNKFSLNL